MSRRLLVALLALALSTPGTGSAQDLAPYAARVDSLSSAWQRAAARRAAWDSASAAARGRLDSITVGPFNMRVSPGARTLATQAARIASDSVARLGPEAHRVIARHQFVASHEDPPRWIRDTATEVIRVSVADARGRQDLDLWAQTDDPRAVSRFFIRHAEQLTTDAVGNVLQRWLGARPLLDSVSTFAWTQLRLELVSSPASVARPCYRGDLLACKQLLGLVPVERPVVAWLDSTQRRAIVLRERDRYQGTNRDDALACLNGADLACIEVLEHQPPVFLRTAGHRLALLQLAIVTGGDGALDRLLRSEAPPPERLVAVAGLPLDTLVARWQVRVRDTRMASDNLSARIAAASFGWIGLLALLSLRNSRWR